MHGFVQILHILKVVHAYSKNVAALSSSSLFAGFPLTFHMKCLHFDAALDKQKLKPDGLTTLIWWACEDQDG